MKKSKKILAFLLSAVLMLSLCACAAPGSSKEVLQNDCITVDGIAVNENYRDEESDALRLVYLFLTITPDTNINMTSDRFDLTFDGEHTYSGDYIAHTAKYASNYYYGKVYKDVHLGETFKTVVTYKVPEAELSSGKMVTLENSDLSEIVKGIKFSTDTIQHFDDEKKLAEAMDPDGYQKAVESRKPADNATCKKVLKEIVGNSWTYAQTGGIVMKVTFLSNNKYEIRSSIMPDHVGYGKYEITKDYIVLTVDETKAVNEVPYSFDNNGRFKLDIVKGYSPYEG